MLPKERSALREAASFADNLVELDELLDTNNSAYAVANLESLMRTYLPDAGDKPAEMTYRDWVDSLTYSPRPEITTTPGDLL